MPTSNLQNGVTNVPEQVTMGGLVFPDPTRCHTWFDDFDQYVAADWLVTEVGSGARQVQNEDGGVLKITNGTSDNDANWLQYKGGASSTVVETFKWAANRSMWFKTRFKLLEATETEVVIGLQVTDTDPLDVPDGLFFIKVDGSTTLNFRAEKNDTATAITVGTLADATYYTCGFWWDADVGMLHVYFNDDEVGQTSTTTNFPDDEELAVSFGVQNGQNAVASALSVDYIFVSKDRQAPTG